MAKLAEHPEGRKLALERLARALNQFNTPVVYTWRSFRGRDEAIKHIISRPHLKKDLKKFARVFRKHFQSSDGLFWRRAIAKVRGSDQAYFRLFTALTMALAPDIPPGAKFFAFSKPKILGEAEGALTNVMVTRDTSDPYRPLRRHWERLRRKCPQLPPLEVALPEQRASYWKLERDWQKKKTKFIRLAIPALAEWEEAFASVGRRERRALERFLRLAPASERESLRLALFAAGELLLEMDANADIAEKARRIFKAIGAKKRPFWRRKPEELDV